MKKCIIAVLALLFTLYIADTTFAATNPFTDLPAKHWAYDAVNKLAQAGILDGYGDGTYRGETLATRYELAQATAKAMARADKADAQMKSLIDKLAVEFASELDNLGVRVAKLEQNASSIKFSGDSRLRFVTNNSSQFDMNGQSAASIWEQRIRINASADLNEKAKFYGRLMTNWRDASIYGTSYQAHIYWDYGYFEWLFSPTFKIAVGRQMADAAYNIFYSTGGYDAISLKFGAASDKFTGKVAYGDLGSYNGSGGPTVTNGSSKPLILVDANYKINKDWSINGAMYYSTNAEKTTAITGSPDANGNIIGFGYVGGFPFQVYAFGVKGNLADNWKMTAQYIWNSANIPGVVLNDSKNAWVAELWYKGAEYKKVGSWGLSLNYRYINPFAFNVQWTNGILVNDMQVSSNEIYYGKKGFGIQANYTISKNAIVQFTYLNLTTNNTNNILVSGNNMNSFKYLPMYYLQMNVSF